MTAAVRPFDVATAGVRPLDATAAADAVARQDRLTKPRGSLGRVEALGVHLAGIAGGGAAINVLARQAGASVTVVDVGVATPLPEGMGATVRQRSIRLGTADMTVEAAMTIEECRAALDIGATVAADLVAGGAAALVTGEMGIGNTTAAAAVIAALLGRRPSEVTGRGTGVDDAGL